MAVLRQYILSVSAAAILCGLVTVMIPQGSMKGICKLVCGVFLTLLVVEPVTRFDPGKILSSFTGQITSEGETAAAFGEELALDSMVAYIKRESEAYILDKAKELGITVEVQVLVGHEELPVPAAAVIRGSVSRHMRQELEQLIEENLGIAKENLQWIG